MICRSGGSKSRLAKAAGAEPAGQMRDEKLHAVVAQSTFASEKAKDTSRSEHFLKLRCRKSARRCGAKHICKWKSYKHLTFGTLFEVEMSKKCTPLWREAHFEVKLSKRTMPGPLLGDRCGTSYDLASLFRGRRSTLDRWSGKIAKRIGTRPSALHSTFHFWRKSRRIVSFLMLSISKNEEVSQTCFVFDFVKCKNWGCLAELLHFSCCQVQKLRKSRRTASFSSLQINR